MIHQLSCRHMWAGCRWPSVLIPLARNPHWAGLTALFICASFVSSAWAQPRYAFDSTPGFLPKHVVPSRYALALDLDPARDEFAGKADIAITVRQHVKHIVVHAHKLTSVSLALEGQGKTRALKAVTDAKTQSWSLAPEDADDIAPGNYTLRIAYRGAVHRTAQGLYRAGYTVNGEPSQMLGTQLQARFARTVFPAFDEPSFRAAFEISVRAPQEYTVLSNMPLASQSADGTARVHRFQATPRMPSYLVAVAVGRFDFMEEKIDGVALRIVTAPGKREQARYAMETTKQLLTYYADYFGVAYVLPKLDQLAVPSTRSGAMEDWGLISYAENTLLYDPARSSPNAQRWASTVIAHELAHQWFGNLVTTASWEEIWLNEAFATWLARKATMRLHPEWQLDLRQRLSVDWAMQRDSGPETRAIRSGPVSENRVLEVFDAITYQKGGAVLSMLEQWLGEDAFRKGLAAYVKGQSYSNATAGDLWHFLSGGSDKTVSRMAASWTDQEGFPVVAVEEQCVSGKTRVSLAQAQFQTDDGGNSQRLWKIPVQVARGKDARTVLLEKPAGSLEFDGCTDQPLVVNAGGVGFYRVQYGTAHLAALTERFERLAPVDRVTLLNDTFALAQAGRADLGAFFKLLSAISRVHGPDRATLFSDARGALEFMDRAFAGASAQASVRAAGRLLFGDELARLGWHPKSHEDSETLKLRGDLITLLASFEDAEVAAEAGRLFDLEASGQQPLPASIRSAVIYAAGASADRARFDDLVRLLRTAASEEDRWVYARALAAGRDPGRVEEVLAMSLQEWLPPNIASSLPSLVGQRYAFGARAYQFVLEHWDRLAARSGEMYSETNWLLPRAAANLNERASADRLIDDQNRKLGDDGVSPARQVAHRIRLNAAFKEREAKKLEADLQSWRPGP